MSGVPVRVREPPNNVRPSRVMFDESLEAVEKLVVSHLMVGPVLFEVVVSVLSILVSYSPCLIGVVVALFIVV